MKETLARPPVALQSINEEQQTDDNQEDSWPNSNNATTYQNAFQNYSRRAVTSFETTNPIIDEEIETIKLDENPQQRSQSASLTKTPFKRPTTKQPVETLQLNDDNHDPIVNDLQEPRETILPPIKGSNQTEYAQSRKIRQLQNKLSRQEEEAKKQLNELQSKQSRLENALKLLIKQTKPRSQTQDDSEVSTKGQSPGKRIFSSTQSLSFPFSDNRLSRTYSGVWRPDTSTIHRLQGN